MDGKISLNWDIHYACNYRCPYCWFNGKWHELSKHNRYLPLAELIDAWRNIYNRYGPVHIEIVGGEPFIYPRFTELIKELSQMHVIHITTNLSVNPDNFLNQIDTSRVKISPTFHPLFTGLDGFIERVLALKERGMGTKINYLAYPPQLKLIDHYAQRFNQENLSLFVMPFWGKHNGIAYPAGYTKQEKKLIGSLLTIKGGERSQLESKETKGKLCEAGHLYAIINANFEVFRCSGNTPHGLGSFLGKDLKLLNGPLPCASDLCPCNEWASLLVKEENTASAVPSGGRKMIDRSRIRPNRVFITWDIHYACNYNCSYCNTPKPWNPPGSWDRDRDKVVYLESGRWLEIWEDIHKKYGSCEIHITGGEPFVYPSFLELIKGLSKMHTLEIITNLSSDVSDIIDSVTPDRVRIGTTFHPEFADLNEFLKKHIILRKHGFETWSNYVAYPPQMNEMANYKKEFDKLRISFNMQPFMGKFGGREYPGGYTDSELAYLKGCYDNDDIINKKTVEWKTGTEHRNMEGRPCRMGQMYAKVYPVADAYRCCANGSQKLGNLIGGSFDLLNEALSCECKQCYCWRCMLVENEENWSQHWVIPEKKNYENVYA